MNVEDSSRVKKYHEILQQAIDKSGWSLREITRRCKANGVNISDVYLSKISKGICSPASDKINRALVDVLSLVTDITYEKLRIAAYKEKIPEDVLKVLIAEGI